MKMLRNASTTIAAAPVTAHRRFIRINFSLGL
jgi:hypothetical protein